MRFTDQRLCDRLSMVLRKVMLMVVENDVKDNRFCPTYQNRRPGQEIAAFTIRQKSPGNA